MGFKRFNTSLILKIYCNVILVERDISYVFIILHENKSGHVYKRILDRNDKILSYID
jgi:hypothetical protein